MPSFSITSLVQEFSIIPSKLWTAASPWYELFLDLDSAELSSESPPLLRESSYLLSESSATSSLVLSLHFKFSFLSATSDSLS